eukprot:3934710-Rhodomonas_salina.2
MEQLSNKYTEGQNSPELQASTKEEAARLQEWVNNRLNDFLSTAKEQVIPLQIHAMATEIRTTVQKELESLGLDSQYSKKDEVDARILEIQNQVAEQNSTTQNFINSIQTEFHDFKQHIQTSANNDALQQPVNNITELVATYQQSQIEQIQTLGARVQDLASEFTSFYTQAMAQFTHLDQVT